MRTLIPRYLPHCPFCASPTVVPRFIFQWRSAMSFHFSMWSNLIFKLRLMTSSVYVLAPLRVVLRVDWDIRTASLIGIWDAMVLPIIISPRLWTCVWVSLPMIARIHFILLAGIGVISTWVVVIVSIILVISSLPV